jgi:hypothetical protein
VDAGTHAVRSCALPRQPAPAPSSPCSRRYGARPSRRNRPTGTPWMAGGARGLRGGAGAADEPEPAGRLAPQLRPDPQRPRPGQADRPRVRRQGQRRPDGSTRRRPPRAAARPRRARRRAGPAGVRTRLAPRRATGTGTRQRGRRDGRAAAGRRARRRAPAGADRRRDREAEDQAPPAGRHAVPQRPDPAGGVAVRPSPARHEHLRRQRSRPSGAAVLRRRPAAGGVPDRPHHGQRVDRCGRVVLRGAVQHHHGCRPGVVPGPGGFIRGMRGSLDALTDPVRVPASRGVG